MNESVLRWAFGVVGTVAATWNVVWLVMRWRLLFSSIQVEGRVECFDDHARRPETKQAYFRCVVIYPFGDEWLETAAPPKRCAVGSMVPVRFLPEDPGTALVGRLPDLLFGPIFMSLWGVALIAGAVFFHGNP